MTRTTRSALLAVPLLALLGGCSTGEATQGSVRDGVRERLVADRDIDEGPAGEIADCVARGLFESGGFSKEERDDATRAQDGDPHPDLLAKVEALFAECGVDDPGGSDAG
jgi:hypothetical protein